MAHPVEFAILWWCIVVDDEGTAARSLKSPSIGDSIEKARQRSLRRPHIVYFELSQRIIHIKMSMFDSVHALPFDC